MLSQIPRECKIFSKEIKSNCYSFLFFIFVFFLSNRVCTQVKSFRLTKTDVYHILVTQELIKSSPLALNANVVNECFFLQKANCCC